MRSWCVKGPIKTFYVLKEPFKIGDCIIERENGKMVISVDVEAEDEGQAKTIALEKIRKALLSWSLTTNEFLDFDDFLSDIVETTPSREIRTMIKAYKVDALLVVNRLKPQEKEEIENAHELLKKSDECAIKAAEYYQKGLTLRAWPHDAFLNFYKVCELIFEKYYTEADAQELTDKFQKPKAEITTKEKMRYMCEEIGVERGLWDKIGKIVDIRSTQDVAHAKLSEVEISKEDLTACMKMAKQVILNYLINLE